jgi:hypothetical protein
MAAPKGNQFSYNGGRPPKYDSPEEMWNKAVEFFESTKTSSGIYKPTIEGLVFHLGFSSRQSLLDYSVKNEVFMDTTRRMKQFIKACYEKNLYGFAWAGASFALRNLGKEDWKDEITEHSNQTITKVEIVEKKRDE